MSGRGHLLNRFVVGFGSMETKSDYALICVSRTRLSAFPRIHAGEKKESPGLNPCVFMQDLHSAFPDSGLNGHVADLPIPVWSDDYVEVELLIVGGTESACAAAVQPARLGVQRSCSSTT